MPPCHEALDYVGLLSEGVLEDSHAQHGDGGTNDNPNKRREFEDEVDQDGLPNEPLDSAGPGSEVSTAIRGVTDHAADCSLWPP